MSGQPGYIYCSYEGLTIYYLHESPIGEEALVDEAELLRQFAQAWNQGQQDVNRRDPYSQVPTCDIIFVKATLHISSVTPNEAEHITVALASTDRFTETGLLRETVHIYAIDSNVSLGYYGWLRHSSQNLNVNKPSIRRLYDAASQNCLLNL